MPSDIDVFLSTLFAGCSKGYITLTAIHPDGQHPTPSRHIALQDDICLETALGDLHQANRQGWGGFFGVATRQTNLGCWRRGGALDLCELPALFVDLDIPEKEALQRLRAHDPPTSCLVASGGGVHAYWWLEQPTSDWSQATHALQRLRQRLSADKSSVSQVLRLPNTYNTKPQRHNASCHILDLTCSRYSLADFAALPLSISHPRQVATPVRPSVSSVRPLNSCLITAIEMGLLHDYGGRWQANGWLGALCPCGHCYDRPCMHFGYVESKSKSRGGRLSRPYPASLPKTTLEYLTYGAPVGQRNAALFAAACQFRDAGYSLAEATSQLVTRYLADSEAHELSGTRAHEARRTIQSAYTRPPRRDPTG